MGRVSLTFLPRLPHRLGPVASTSHRLAARIANTLKSGTAVKDFGGLNNCSVILLCAPAGSIDRLAGALANAPVDWNGKVLLLCDSDAYTCDVPKFRELGAAMASINGLDGIADRYIVEGDPIALREARALVRDLGGKPIEIASDRIRLYDAALTLSGSLFTPLMETCTECIRQVGVTGPAAATLAEALLQRSIRAFMHSGRKSWTGPIARAQHAAIDRESHALAAVKPVMGRYFRTSADLALELYRTFPELTRYDEARRTSRK